MTASPSTSTTGISKQVTHTGGKGTDQLGNVVGVLQPGDTAKLHMTAYFTAQRPMFSLGKKKFGDKVRQVEFVRTQSVGDTAFISIDVTGKHKHKKPSQQNPSDLLGVIGFCVQDMQLGESATFTVDASVLVKNPNAAGKIGPGHYKKVDDDAHQVVFQMDLFRVVRNGTLHCRPTRNGTGAGMPGSYSMGA
jgi:hypothetical protein